MTKKEFKYAMQRGLGRCIVELDKCENIEKYRDLVLWGCTHELAYDAQCEGTRSYYLYELISFYPDSAAFLQTVENQINKSMFKAGWKFNQDCQLLAMFARDGNKYAKECLINCYIKLFGILKNKRKYPDNGVFPERDNFESLCISIIFSINSMETAAKQYTKFVKDMSYLICHNKLFENDGFEWFQSDCESMLGKKYINEVLLRSAKSSEEILSYINNVKRFQSILTRKVDRKSMTAKEVYFLLKNTPTEEVHFSRFLASGWQRSGRCQEVQSLANYYSIETDEVIKIQLLELLANRDCSYALNVEKLISDTDTESENAKLQDLAFRALGFIKSDRVYEFAMSMITNESRKSEVISMLSANYRENDRDIFIELAKGMKISYENGEWHSAFSDIMEIFMDNSIKKPPKELLIYMYENTLCSFCRERVVMEMGKRRMLTNELLQEMLYDSYDEIREYAQGKLSEN